MFLQSLSLIVFYLYENNAIKFVFEIERNIQSSDCVAVCWPLLGSRFISLYSVM